VVENQAAEGLESVTRTLDRLTGEGVRRHAAVHMIIGVLTETFAAMAVNQEPFDEQAYGARLDAIDPGAWIGARMRRDLGAVDL
jgi:phage portal protein BeeE